MRFSGHVLWASSPVVKAQLGAPATGEFPVISGQNASESERIGGGIRYAPVRQPHEWVEGVFEVRDGKIYRIDGSAGGRVGSGSVGSGLAGADRAGATAGGSGLAGAVAVGSERLGSAQVGSAQVGSSSVREGSDRGGMEARGRLSSGASGRTAEAASKMVDYSGVWVVPGLVDAHCHIGIGPQGETAGEAMLAQAHANRDAGVLLARDCGVIGDNSWVSGRRDALTILRAGRHIAKKKRYIHGYALEVEDGELPAAMAQQAKAGSGWVKIVGDWIDRSNGAESDLDPLWETSALQDGVAAAHEAGARVTVHTFSERAIDGLLEAGVDCIEHGTGMRPEHVAEAAARGIAVTPTLMQVALFPQFAQAGEVKYPVYAQTMRRLWERHEATLASFVDAGVQLLPGTDAGGYQQHGRVAHELTMWRSMGLSDAQIVDLGTWRAREFLGVPGLSEGADADLVMYEQDPREDVEVLKRPARVLYRGQVRD